jgi:hypothetical protein
LLEKESRNSFGEGTLLNKTEEITSFYQFKHNKKDLNTLAAWFNNKLSI